MTAFPYIERDFIADFDGTRQTFLLLPPCDPQRVETLVVALHGHGSHQEQFMTPEIYDDALGQAVRFAQAENLLYVTPEYRGNSWMNAAATADIRQLIALLRVEFPVRRVVLVGGSMGGTSVLTFAALHPEGIDGVVSLCPATDIAALFHELTGGPWAFIASAIRESYGGTPEDCPAEYALRSSLHHAERLTMPIILVHGDADQVLHVRHVRELVARLHALGAPLDYTELPNGDHDAPVAHLTDALGEIIHRINRMG